VATGAIVTGRTNIHLPRIAVFFVVNPIGVVPLFIAMAVTERSGAAEGSSGQADPIST